MEIPRYLATGSPPVGQVNGAAAGAGDAAAAKVITAASALAGEIAQAEAEIASNAALARYEAALSAVRQAFEEEPRTLEDDTPSHETLLERFEEVAGGLSESLNRQLSNRAQRRFAAGARTVRRSAREEIETLRRQRQLDYMEAMAADEVDTHLAQGHFDQAGVAAQAAFDSGAFSPAQLKAARARITNERDAHAVMDLAQAEQYSDAYARANEIADAETRRRSVAQVYAAEERARREQERIEAEEQDDNAAQWLERLNAGEISDATYFELAQSYAGDELNYQQFKELEAEIGVRLRTGPEPTLQRRVGVDAVLLDDSLSLEAK